MQPQLAAAVEIAVVGNVTERWLRDGPYGPIVPLLPKHSIWSGRPAGERAAAGR